MLFLFNVTEREQSEDIYNEQRKNEEKYNIILDIQTKQVGEKNYWNLREYFTKRNRTR